MSPIDECTWNFGNGSTEACDLGSEVNHAVNRIEVASVQAIHDVTIQTTHVYTQAGVYIVTVAASNDAGTVIAAQEVTIEVPTAEPPVASPPQPGELYLPYMNR